MLTDPRLTSQELRDRLHDLPVLVMREATCYCCLPRNHECVHDQMATLIAVWWRVPAASPDMKKPSLTISSSVLTINRQGRTVGLIPSMRFPISIRSKTERNKRQEVLLVYVRLTILIATTSTVTVVIAVTACPRQGYTASSLFLAIIFALFTLTSFFPCCTGCDP